MGKGKHVKKKAVVKAMLAHTGLDLVVHGDDWFIVCECEHAEPLGGLGEAEQTRWHAAHIVDVLQKKGMLR